VLIKKTVITSDDGDDYLVGCCIDITDRKKAELALVESERRFRSLVQYSPDIIIILEKDYTVRYVTPSFQRTFGIPENEVVGRPILDFIHEEDIPSIIERINYILEAPETRTSLECRFRKTDGGFLTLASSFNNLLFEPAVSGIVINSSDVTEFRNQADEIQRMNKLLEKDNKKLQVDLKKEVKKRINSKAVNFEEFKEIYPDDAACLQYVSYLKWKNGYECRKCGNEKECNGKSLYSKRCTICGYDESATAYTIFNRLKFPIIKAFYMVFLINSQRKITAKNLSDHVSLRKETCSVFKRKLLTVLKDKKNSTKPSQGWEDLVLVPMKKPSK
jgi:PAS domain S-box-containing protein